MLRFGSGDLGERFVARTDAETLWSVALLPPERAADLKLCRLLLTEANAAHRLEHRAAVPVVDAGRVGDAVYSAAPLVLGQPLGAVLRAARQAGEGLDHRLLCHIGAEVAEALVAAHRWPWFPGAPAPMVHGAVCPRSIVISYEGRVVLTGLGVGRARWSLPPSTARLPWAAPERLDGRALTARTDAYGLGLTLYDAFTGREGFRRPTAEATEAAIREAHAPSLHAGNLKVRLEVADVLREMMAPRVEARPGDLSVPARVFREAAEGPEEAFRRPLALLLERGFSVERENALRRLRVQARAQPPGGRSGEPGPMEWTADLSAAPPEVPVGPSDPGAAPPRIGRYRLEAELSARGARRVYRARDPNLDRSVVLHTLDPSRAEESRLEPSEAVAIFKREARIAAGLEHPRLPQLFDAGKSGGIYFSVYRHFSGTTLFDLVERSGPLGPEQLIPLACDWAEALAALHREGWVHADLRATNVLVHAERGGAVVDLSMAHAFDGPEHPLTRANLLVMAPETLAGRRYDPIAEQFAFGGLLYQALVGTRPFRGIVDEELERAIRRAEPRPPREMGVHLPEGLERLLMRLLSRDPGARCSSFEEVAKLLRPERVEATRSSTQVSLPEPQLGPSAELAACLARLAERAFELAPIRDPGPVATAGALARRLGWEAEEELKARLLAGLGSSFSTRGANPERAPDREWVPELVRAPLLELLGLLAAPTEASELAQLVWMAVRYHALARPPEGHGTHSPRTAARRMRTEAAERAMPSAVSEAFVELLRERISALDLSARDDRILVAATDDLYGRAIEQEGFEVVCAKDGATAWSALAGGGFLGAVVEAGLGDGEDRVLLRRGREPELRSVRFALLGGELQPEDHGPHTCAVPRPSEDAIRAVVRGWRAE